jgi:protein HIRA/HIR1
MESQELDNASNAIDIDIPSLPKSGVPSCVAGNKIKSDTFDHLDIKVDGTQFLKGKTDWIDSIVAPPIIQKSQSRTALSKVKSHFIIKSNPDDPTTILECHNAKLDVNKQSKDGIYDMFNKKGS